MKIGRQLRRKKVSSYEELLNAVKNKEIVISIVGSTYEDISKKIKMKKNLSKGGKVIGDVMMLAGIFTGPLAPVLIGGGASIDMISGANGLKKYELREDKKNKRMDLIRIKGADAYDPKYDIITD